MGGKKKAFNPISELKGKNLGESPKSHQSQISEGKKTQKKGEVKPLGKKKRGLNKKGGCKKKGVKRRVPHPDAEPQKKAPRFLPKGGETKTPPNPKNP